MQIVITFYPNDHWLAFDGSNMAILGSGADWPSQDPIALMLALHPEADISVTVAIPWGQYERFTQFVRYEKGRGE